MGIVRPLAAALHLSGSTPASRASHMDVRLEEMGAPGTECCSTVDAAGGLGDECTDEAPTTADESSVHQSNISNGAAAAPLGTWHGQADGARIKDLFSRLVRQRQAHGGSHEICLTDIHEAQKLLEFELSADEVRKHFPGVRPNGIGAITYRDFFGMMKAMVLAGRIDLNKCSSGNDVDDAQDPEAVVADEKPEVASTLVEDVSEIAEEAREDLQEASPSDEVLQVIAAMEKRMLSCSWDGDCIIVEPDVRIESPYNPQSCSAGPEMRSQAVLKRVRNVLALERASIQRKSGATPAVPLTVTRISGKKRPGLSAVPISAAVNEQSRSSAVDESSVQPSAPEAGVASPDKAAEDEEENAEDDEMPFVIDAAPVGDASWQDDSLQDDVEPQDEWEQIAACLDNEGNLGWTESATGDADMDGVELAEGVDEDAARALVELAEERFLASVPGLGIAQQDIGEADAESAQMIEAHEYEYDGRPPRGNWDTTAAGLENSERDSEFEAAPKDGSSIVLGVSSKAGGPPLTFKASGPMPSGNGASMKPSAVKSASKATSRRMPPPAPTTDGSLPTAAPMLPPPPNPPPRLPPPLMPPALSAPPPPCHPHVKAAPSSAPLQSKGMPPMPAVAIQPLNSLPPALPKGTLQQQGVPLTLPTALPHSVQNGTSVAGRQLSDHERRSHQELVWRQYLLRLMLQQAQSELAQFSHVCGAQNLPDVGAPPVPLQQVAVQQITMNLKQLSLPHCVAAVPQQGIMGSWASPQQMSGFTAANVLGNLMPGTLPSTLPPTMIPGALNMQSWLASQQVPQVHEAQKTGHWVGSDQQPAAQTPQEKSQPSVPPKAPPLPETPPPPPPDELAAPQPPPPEKPAAQQPPPSEEPKARQPAQEVNIGKPSEVDDLPPWKRTRRSRKSTLEKQSPPQLEKQGACPVAQESPAESPAEQQDVASAPRRSGAKADAPAWTPLVSETTPDSAVSQTEDVGASAANVDSSADASDIARQIAEAFAFLPDTDSDDEETVATSVVDSAEELGDEPPMKRPRTQPEGEVMEPATAQPTTQEDGASDCSKVGMLPPLTDCTRCGRKGLPGIANAGVYCGRVIEDGTFVGCGAAICWRCMRRGPNEQLGAIRTSKEECEGMGASAWWMHDFCMREEDKNDYYGGADAAVEPADDPEPEEGDATTQEDDGSIAVVAPEGDMVEEAAERFAWE